MLANQAPRWLAPAMPVFAGKPAPTGFAGRLGPVGASLLANQAPRYHHRRHRLSARFAVQMP
ncbi:hypothetical protein E3U47_14895 [Pseudomonas sp. RIT623]|nr:hypothetical protein E3U47_14895 [Pseudomonas sp. RIT623]